jgi:hypothetical protein
LGRPWTTSLDVWTLIGQARLARGIRVISTGEGPGEFALQKWRAALGSAMPGARVRALRHD